MPREPAPKKSVTKKTFDPTLLDRTIIAIPLLRAMEDVKLAEEWVEKARADVVKDFNAVIFLARDYPEGPGGAVAQVKEVLARVFDDLRLTGEDRKRNQLLQGAPRAREKRRFVVARLDRRVRVALVDHDRKEDFRAVDRLRPTHFDVIIDVNLHHPQGRTTARKWVVTAIEHVITEDGSPELELKEKGDGGGQYVFARLRREHIEKLLVLDTAKAWRLAETKNERATNEACEAEAGSVRPEICRAIHSIWPDFPIKPCITDSITTVKADAALSCFSTLGGDITWAVIDSGIAAAHPHFALYRNIDDKSPLHHDFTSAEGGALGALQDAFGHGTHVAGIIAGEHDSSQPGEGGKPRGTLNALRRVRIHSTAQESDVEKVKTPIRRIRGMAPKCQLVSLKVLDDVGFGEVSNVIAALSWVLDANHSGRAELKIHGVNISLGYEIDPEWFACGESPLCIEVNRVVRSGVVVVVAAGNTGYGTLASRERSTGAGLDITINDPGNAALAITVGSTHRSMPHRYGVSFFSSKGPTGDGRPKPDLVAPGEKILSCAAGSLLADRAPGEKDFTQPDGVHYVEDSGTSMAAPHVSGIVAGFLSVRREFIAKPEEVKRIFCETATDLKRDRYFQGAGLVDLMRAIQSI